MCVCVCVRVRACVRVCACVCVHLPDGGPVAAGAEGDLLVARVAGEARERLGHGDEERLRII